MKERINRIALITHIVSMILCMLLLFGVSVDDHLRWYLGYVVVWSVFVSALVVLVTLPDKAKRRKAFYFLSVFLAPIFVLFFFAVLGIIGFFMLLLVDKTFIPQKKIADNKEYIIRSQPPSIAVRGDHIYRKSGLLEKFVGRIEECRNDAHKSTIESFWIEKDSIHIHYRTDSRTDSICVYNIIQN